MYLVNDGSSSGVGGGVENTPGGVAVDVGDGVGGGGAGAVGVGVADGGGENSPCVGGCSSDDDDDAITYIRRWMWCFVLYILVFIPRVCEPQRAVFRRQLLLGMMSFQYIKGGQLQVPNHLVPRALGISAALLVVDPWHSLHHARGEENASPANTGICLCF